MRFGEAPGAPVLPEYATYAPMRKDHGWDVLDGATERAYEGTRGEDVGVKRREKGWG